MKRVKFEVKFSGSATYYGQAEADSCSAAESLLSREKMRVPFVSTTTPHGEVEFEEYNVVIIDDLSIKDQPFSEEVASDPDFWLENWPEYFEGNDINRLTGNAPETFGVKDGGETTICVSGRAVVAFVVNYEQFGALNALDDDDIEEIEEIETRQAYKETVRIIERAMPFWVNIEDFEDVVKHLKVEDYQR